MTPLITLTTDFGEGSPYVAAMKGVILSINAAARIVDLSHAIPPQNIRAGALALADTVPWYPQGTIHVAVVDPGVGTARALIYAEIDEQRFVGPDNGLFSLLAREHRVAGVRTLTNREHWLTTVSNTFHGRDVMAPVAAHLSLGLDPALLGPPQPKLVEIEWPAPVAQGNVLRGEVIAIDSYGNLITNIHRADFNPPVQVRLLVDSTLIDAELVSTYGQRAPGVAVALVGSSGRLEIAVVQGNAAGQFKAGVGATVSVSG